MTLHEAALGGFAAAAPAGFTRLSRPAIAENSGQYPFNIVFQGVNTTMSLFSADPGTTQNGPGSAVGSWDLRSFTTGLIVKTGGAIAAGGTWTATSDLACGMYRLYLRNASSAPMGGGLLCVTRNVTGMPLPPNPPLMDSSTIITRTLSGSRRHRVTNAAAPPAGDLAVIDNELPYEVSYYKAADTSRPKHLLLNFPNGTAMTGATGAGGGVRTVVARYPDIDYWEPYNEPTGGIPNASFVPEQQQFYTDVKAVAPTKKVLTGATVHIGLTAQTDLAAFYAAGGGNYADVIAFHTYNAHVGDLTALRRSWDSYIATLTTAGQHLKPRVITEAGGFFAAEFGAGAYMRQAVQGMLDLLGAEQYGVQKEDWHYYQPANVGFDDYPSHMSSRNQPYPLVGMLLTHSQELLGKVWESRLDFGTIDNDMVIGSSYRGADSTAVVSLMAPGKRAHPVTLQLTGGSPTSLVTVDCWGNTGSVTVTGGLAQVTADLLPSYVRLPAGVTATPTGGDTRWGTKQTTTATAKVDPAPGLTTVFSDSATRADGAVGNGWTTFGGAPAVSIVSNKFGKTGGSFIKAGIVRDLGAASGRLELTTGGTLPTEAGLVFRYSDPSNYWVLYDNNLYKMVAGTLTSLGACKTGGAQAVVLNGSSITASGTSTYTDTFNQTATMHGVLIDHPNATADDFVFSSGSDGSFGAQSLASVLTGPYQNRLVYDTDNNGDNLSVWNAGTAWTPGSTQTLTVSMPAAYVDRVLVHCPPPWQNRMCVLLDFDVQTLDANGTTWTTRATVNTNPTIVPVTTTRQDGADAWWDSYWNDEHVFEVPITRTSTAGLRLVIRQVSYEGTPTLDARNTYGAVNSTGQPVIAGLGSGVARISLQRLAAYDGGVATPPVTPPVTTGQKYLVLRIT